ncbi:RNase adaptor protein RapZ [Halorhodospira abdelmalekii]|uniref:RNase adapter RapZ n=1 Tax=Halorhodospira abdelmalekii TaxID=421629 RepID=UPI001904E4A4|nr:RNase adaptor protein RapZ [Halorhodospira abdelmalekii]
MAPVRLIIVSGLSGSGKSVALHTLEDAGFYCIDNLPVSLITDFARYALRNPSQTTDHQYAVGIDARNPRSDLQSLPERLNALEGQITPELLFLYADDAILMRRYSETRRRHPLADPDRPLSEALRRERQLLEPLRESAAWSIDTSHLNVHDLRALIYAQLAGERPQLALLIESFGFKHGVPSDADYVFDARCLPNPHWVPELRPKTGRDPEVRAFLADFPETATLYGQIRDMITHWLPTYRDAGRCYLTIAIGCTGGQHRSVYLAERLAAELTEHCNRLTLRHRELS